MYRSKCYEPIFKIFYDVTYTSTNRCSCNFIINLYKTSESAMQASYDKSDSKRQSNIREGKVNPSKDAVSILFLGIDDNEGRRKMAKLQNIQERIL